MTATAAPPAADPVVAEALRAELEGLVRIAARRPNLVVRYGKPGCAWSFHWDADAVRVNPEDLAALAPDLCRGLALHEAAHAAVTVLHELLAPAHLARIHPLLNALEDIRIEIWMRSRFPGAAPWIRAYNDAFYGANRAQPLPRSRQVQFLCGILELWWYGATRPGMLPEVLEALDACHEPIAAATGCQPPLTDDAAGILASQRAMWEIVKARIVPAWERLVALDKREGIDRLACREGSEFLERSGAGPARPIRGSARLRPKRSRRRPARRHLPAPTDRRGCSGGDGAARPPGDAAAAETAVAEGHDAYDAAWKRITAVADRLGDELLRVLVPRQRLRWTAGHPWGPRLDLDRAMQFEADPRHYRTLWSRPILPRRRDPAILLLVDHSSSMHDGQRIDRALEGTVLLTEVCHRIGVPAAVWSFANDVRTEHAWDAPFDAAARRRIGLLPDRCDGSTDMAKALVAVGRAFAARHGDPKLLFVIGDGEPNEHEPTRAAIRRLEADGIATVGLGLGPGTARLAEYFQTCVTEIHPERLVDHVADLLGAALLATCA